MLEAFNGARADEAMPHLAALIATSAFDLAVHDAYGVLHGRDIYETYNAEFLSADLSEFLEPQDESVSFEGKYPRTRVESAHWQVFLVSPLRRLDSRPEWTGKTRPSCQLEPGREDGERPVP